MTGNAVQVFVAAFDSEKKATDTLKEFLTMDRDGSVELIDAAVVVRRAYGKVTFSETADPGGRTWAKRGAVAGGLVGLIFPPSILVSAVVGGVGGGIWGKVRDKGFDDADLKRVGESLPPGGAAVIAIAEDRVVEQLQRGLAGIQHPRETGAQCRGGHCRLGRGRDRRRGDHQMRTSSEHRAGAL